MKIIILKKRNSTNCMILFKLQNSNIQQKQACPIFDDIFQFYDGGISDSKTKIGKIAR